MKIIIKFTLICLIFCHCKSKGEQNTLPAFTLLLSDSATIINTGTILSGNPTILVFFSPDCEHCQKETEEIINNLTVFNKTSFYFITIDPVDRMKVFEKYYKLKRYPSITIGKDYTYSFFKFYKPEAPPYLVVFDKKKELRGIFKGQVEITSIVNFINTL